MTQTKERDTLAKLRADMTTANQKATQLSAIVLNHQETLEVSRQEYTDQQAENLLIHEQLDAHYEFHCDLKARVVNAETTVADQQEEIDAIKLAREQADCVHEWMLMFGKKIVSEHGDHSPETYHNCSGMCEACGLMVEGTVGNIRQAARWFRKLPTKGVE